ncbi:hypothetical protein LT493_16750 [Streptomyces tricolor]|nr:hypothetical protein [Streptomyces tricolor]
MLALGRPGSPGPLILALALITGVAQSTMYGPLGALLSEMFGTRVRYTGASLGYQAATLLGAGFSPLIASSLLASSDGGSARPVAAVCGGAAITASPVRRAARDAHLSPRRHAVLPRPHPGSGRHEKRESVSR